MHYQSLNLMKSYYFLLVVSLTISAFQLSGQDIMFYHGELHAGDSTDPGFDTKIDSLWKASEAGKIDSLAYRDVIEELQDYYETGSDSVIRDKAEFYSYSYLLTLKDYASIIERFENNFERYSHRAFTLVNELHRRAYIRLSGKGLAGYRSRLDSLAGSRNSIYLDDLVQHYMQLQIGDVAPAFEVVDKQGTVHRLVDLTNKVVILDFWATWCAPCVEDIPEIRALHQKHEDRGDVVVISVSIDTDRERWANFVEAKDMTWPQVLQSKEAIQAEDTLMKTYNVLGRPHYFVIDKNGSIRYNSHLNGNKFIPEGLIDRLL